MNKHVLVVAKRAHFMLAFLLNFIDKASWYFELIDWLINEI
jgi:hypothetical protein